jgi:hypothetical protein
LVCALVAAHPAIKVPAAPEHPRADSWVEAQGMTVEIAWSDPRPADDADPIALLTESLADKDDIIQSQYAEIASLRHRLELAVQMLNDAQGKAV